MIDQPENLQGFLEHCSYPEFLTELGVDVDERAPLVDYIRLRTAPDVDALLSATFRLCDDELEDEDLLLLGRIRELCYAHAALLELVSAEDSCAVEPRRLYAHSDDDLFLIAHYAELVTELRGGRGDYFPGLAVDPDQITATVASVLAALVARGYDPLPTSDPFVRSRFGRHIMHATLAGGEAATVVAAIHNLPQYAARCAAPYFAHGYQPGFAGYDEANAAAILTAVLVAADDGSDDEQLEDDDDV